MGRNTSPADPQRPARERILLAAADLFGRHGLRAVGVDRVIAESGVAKATLYAHFSSKDELSATYLRNVDSLWAGKLREAAQAAGEDPRDQLVGMFEAVKGAWRRHGFRGCAFINATAESEPGSLPYQVAVAHKKAVHAWVRELAVAARADDPDVLARQLTLLIDGSLVAGRTGDGEAAAAAAADAAAVLVEQACPPRPGTSAP
ncbi:TetR/AcrR family transcriptional regulator [Streptomyces sp. NPDC094143]|uniref:TetR/AcrR family transcriptional regulator n=1 Tax=Streptomyces sp. NPDC094143 TaxID=3155310 RepID=UPI00332E7166